VIDRQDQVSVPRSAARCRIHRHDAVVVHRPPEQILDRSECDGSLRVPQRRIAGGM
jgi:hypothetical protein